MTAKDTTLNQTTQPTKVSDVQALDADKAEELIMGIMLMFTQVGGDLKDVETRDVYVTDDLGNVTIAREHAERYRALLGDNESVIVEQKNSRIWFYIENPPSLI